MAPKGKPEAVEYGRTYLGLDFNPKPKPKRIVDKRNLCALYLLLWFSNSCQQTVEDDCNNYRNPSCKESPRLNAYKIEKRNEN